MSRVSRFGASCRSPVHFLVAQTRLQLHDTVLLILLGQPGKTLGAGAGSDRRGQEQNSNKDGEQ